MHYNFHYGTMEIPDEYLNRSIHSFLKVDRNASIVLNRESLGGLTLEEFADQQLVQAAQRLPGYGLDRRRRTRVADRPAVEVHYHWRTPEEIRLHQRQMYVGDGASGVVMLTLTEKEVSRNTEGLWAHLLNNFCLETLEGT